MQSALNPEQELISSPDPAFSPAFQCGSCRKSQSASICTSCSVILKPWMLKLPFTSFHILSLFLGFMQVSLILAGAGLFKVCLFLNTDRFSEEGSSGISAPQLCLSCAAASGTSWPTLDLCPHPASWLLWLRLMFPALETPLLQKQLLGLR